MPTISAMIAPTAANCTSERCWSRVASDNLSVDRTVIVVTKPDSATIRSPSQRKRRVVLSFTSSARTSRITTALPR